VVPPRHGRCSLLAALVCCLLAAAPAAADTTSRVTTTSDVVDPGDGVTSLREAIAEATPGERHVVDLPAGVYDLGEDLVVGGGLDVVVRGAGPRDTVIDARGDPTVLDDERAFAVNGGALELSAVTVTGGAAMTDGGGAAMVTVGGRLVVRGSVLAGNTGRRGGAIRTLGGEVRTVRSTLAHNTARVVSMDGGDGGAIHSATSATVLIDRATITGNEAQAGGGAIWHDAATELQVRHSTIARNRAGGAGGAVNRQGGSTGPVVFEDSLVVQGGCSGGVAVAAPDASMTDDASCAPLTLVPDLRLPLARDNGGPTETIALAAGAAPVDAAATCPEDGADQRGLPAPAGAKCDVGAFELQPPAPASAPPPPAFGADRPPATPVAAGPPPAAPVVLAPAPFVGRAPVVPLAALRIRPARFVAGTGRGRGATVTFRMPASGRVRFRVERVAPGRRVGSRCVRATGRNRARAGCKRRIAVRGTLTRRARAGLNTFRFGGRLAGRTLRPGRYELIGVVVEGDRTSRSRRIGFQIVRRSR